MASCQEVARVHLQGEISNKLSEVLTYHSQHVYGGMTIQHPLEVQKLSGKSFSQDSLGIFASGCKGALVYRFAIQKMAPQYWVFAWNHNPSFQFPNKVLTKLTYNKDDINWEKIEHELDHSGNFSEAAEGGVLVQVTIPSGGNCKATIQYLPL